MTLKFSNILIFFVFLVGTTAQSQEIVSEQFPLNTITTSFTSDEGYVFDARIIVPPDSRKNGCGVLMLGGGYGNDLEWRSPGFIQHQGTNMQVTISGKPHSDAPLIANALAKNGFVVYFWSTKRRDDPKREREPNETTAYSIKDLLRFSKSALLHFRSKNLFEDDKTILLGYSLGAVRAANISLEDDQIDALVLLSSAQLTRTSKTDRGRNENKSLTQQFTRSSDADHDGKCNRAEFLGWSQDQVNSTHPLANQTFAELDFYADGLLQDWEISAGFARHNRSQMDRTAFSTKDASGLKWTEDILSFKKTATLIVFGTLDNHQSHHAPIMCDLKKSGGFDHVDLKLVSGVGHQLGPEAGDLVGPISQKSIKVITNWLIKRNSRSRRLPTNPSND